MLSNRLKHKLEGLVSSSPSAFISDGFIHENFISATEIMSYCNKKKAKGFLCKVDFEKAFNCVSWIFLQKLLEQRGFSPRWCSWISSILATNSAILLNDSPSSWFRNKKGLKQGNPLSPMLFILVADHLARVLNHAQSSKLIEGIGQLEIIKKMPMPAIHGLQSMPIFLNSRCSPLSY